MKKNTLLWITSLLLFFSINLHAQYSISGKVTSYDKGVALKGTNIYLENTKTGTSSDNNGTFTFKDLKPGVYNIIFRYQGYYDLNKKVTIKNADIKLSIKMKVNIKELLAVEISDDKIDFHPYSKSTIKKATLEINPVRDLADFMRSIPNVGGVRKGGANLDPVIRGFKFDQLNVQMDNGQSMEGGCPNRMDPTSSHIEASDIEAIEVIKGPHALRYGPNMGGVINMLTLNPRPFDGFQVHVKGNMGYESNWNGQRQNLNIIGGGEKVFFVLSGNNSQYGNYEDGDGNMIRSSFRKMGYTGKLGFAPAKNHKIVVAYSEFFARDVDFLALPMDERTDNTKLYSVDYNATDLGKTLKTIHFKAYRSIIDHTMDNVERSFGDSVAAIANIIADKIGGRFEAGLNIAKGHLFIGADMFKISKDGQRDKHMIIQYPMNGNIPLKIEKLWNNASITNIGLFAEYKRTFKKLEMIAALRFDNNSAYSDSISLLNMMGVDLMGTSADSTQSNLNNISFSLGSTYHLTKEFSIGASLGRGVRSPGMIERFIISLPVGFDNYEYIGNPNLLAEANNEFDLVLKYNKRNIGAFELTGFYSIIQNYIGGVYIPNSVQKPLTADVLGVKKFDNLGTAKMMGFEFGYASPAQYKWKISATAASTMGTINEIEVYTFDNTGNATGSEIVNNDPLAEIPPLDAKINFAYKFLNNKLIPEIGFRYVASQNKVSEASLEPTSPSFSLLNASILYHFSENFEIAAGVNNLLDTKYTEHLNRRIIGSDVRIPEPGRIFYTNLIFNF